ncbi:MAG: hypothetical protein ACI31G_00380 [Bacilli bacterium]
MENNLSIPTEEVNKSKKNLFQNIGKKEIFSIIAIAFGFISIVVFLFTPVVQIDLTNLGKSMVATNPVMEGYHQTIYGFDLLFGNVPINIFYLQSSVVVPEIRILQFNYMILIGLLLILVSSIGLLLMLIFKKNGLLNKFILGGYVIGTVLILLTTVWFYAINGNAPSNLTGYIDNINRVWTSTPGTNTSPVTIYNTLASTYYVTTTTTYPYGLINANMDIGSLLATIFSLVATVFSGLLITKPVETR